MSARVVVICAVAVCCYAQNAVGTARRHALLIGNSHYQRISPVPPPAKNVQLLEAALRGADFEITAERDVTLDQFLKTRQAFLAQLHPGDVVLVYLSGYAIQVRHENFFLPVDYDPATTLDDVIRRAPSMTALRQAVDDKKPGLKIEVVDAPWEVPGGVAITGPGLSTPDLSETGEIMLAFSAQPGTTVPPASADAPSPFTSILADMIRKPGVSLGDVFLTVQREVSRSAAPQRPYLNPVTTANFYFRAPVLDKPRVAEKHLEKRNRKDRQDYVFIEPGTFLMGCVPGDRICERDEKPQHQVTITKGFWMGVTEVDNSAYRRYVADAPKERKMPREAPIWDRKRERPNDPIGGTTWEEARDFCAWVGGRLPTEAEWEYAARAGKQNEIWPLNTENSRDKANFYGKKGNDLYDNTAPVKSFDSNGFGLYDMAGNVWEWVSDWYSPAYFAESPERDPQGPPTGKKHVKRGGSFDSDPEKHLRISIRKPGDYGNAVGFRCVLDNTEKVRAFFDSE